MGSSLGSLKRRIKGQANTPHLLRDFVLEESIDGTYTYVPPFWNWLFCRLDSTALAERLSGTRFQVVGKVAA